MDEENEVQGAPSKRPGIVNSQHIFVWTKEIIWENKLMQDALRILSLIINPIYVPISNQLLLYKTVQSFINSYQVSS